MRKGRLFLASLGVLLAVQFGLPVGKTYAANSVSVDLANQSEVIGDKFSDLNVWSYAMHWSDTEADAQSNGFFATNYPFIKTVHFMTATGGCYVGYSGCGTDPLNDRDLFTNPGNTGTTNDYHFAGLESAIQNVLDKGLKPYLKTGSVPIKLSSSPSLSGSFGVNVRPPSDYNVYYNYIHALGAELVSHFGIQEVKTWRWGVLTEYENADWFTDGVSAASTETAYFKLYDYTVAALESAIGADNVFVGAHAMAVANGLWDPRDLIDHCATGTNYKTGATGTQLDFMSVSFYDTKPGSYSGRTLADTVNLLRDYAIEKGLTGMYFGMDEGRLLLGEDNRDLFSRIQATSFQGAYDARKFKEAIDMRLDWFPNWGLNTEGIWGGADAVSTNVAQLAYKMAGDRRAALSIGGSAGSGDEVSGVAGYNADTNTAHVMLYNFNSDPSATASESPTITLSHLAPAAGTTVAVRTWYVDDTHANFWPTWWSDKGSSLSSGATSWSKYSMEVPKYLTNSADIAYWYSRESTYKSLATLTSTTANVTVSGNAITLSPTLAHHGVAFYEITNAVATANNVTVTDEMNDFSKIASHSAGLQFDSSNVSVIEDTRRLLRSNTNASPAEYAVYNYPSISAFQATALYATDLESIVDIKLYTSPTGAGGSWTQQTGYATSDQLINSNNWTRRVYTLSSVPSGTNFVKLEFRTGGSAVYTPQIGQVKVTYTPAAWTDNLDDLSLTDAASAGLAVDTLNGSALQDGSRIRRTNLNASPAEYVTYHKANLTKIKAVGLYATDVEPTIQNFKFYLSRDGKQWTPVTSTWGDESINSGNWTRRTYTVGKDAFIPGMNFVKIEFPTGGGYLYNPELSKVEITQ